MALYTRTEFAELLGISQAYISMNLKRHKIVINDDNKIDTTLPMNKDFYEKKINKKPKAEKPKSEPKAKPSKITIEKSEPDSERIVNEVNRYNLDLQIKQLEYDKKEQEIELNRLKIAKLSGEVIPTDLVQTIFSQHSKSITTAFHQGADNFIVDISKRTGINRDEMASLRGILIEIINQSVKDANEDSKEAVKNIVKEYAQKKGVGERE